MPLSLHAAYVPSALQMLGTARHLVDTAEKWCAENDCGHDEFIGARIFDDMQNEWIDVIGAMPLYDAQVAGALKGVRRHFVT